MWRDPLDELIEDLIAGSGRLRPIELKRDLNGIARTAVASCP